MQWDTGVVKYYGAAAWHEIPPFTGIGQVIEPRLLPQNKKDPFHELELNPDLRTESITVTFDDIDKDIRGKFQTYSSGIECEFFLYYPSQDLTVSIWFGQLQAPQVYGWKTVKAIATNGYRSRELFLPGRNRRSQCTAAVFGGLLPSADAIRSNLCPYDRHVGGTEGLFKTGTTPFTNCPKTKDACQARFGHTRYFGGFVTDVSAVQQQHQNTTYLSASRGNASNLPEPVRIVAGTKPVRGLQLLLWRRESPPGYPQGFVRTVWDIGEGPFERVWDIQVNGKYIDEHHLAVRLGTRGQSATHYAPDVANFSSTAHFFANYGQIDSGTISGAQDLNAECWASGFKEVCVYTDDDPVTKTRIYSEDRVWWLLELYKNQKFGFGYAESKFTLADWITASAWTQMTVTFVATFEDGEEYTYVSKRTIFNAILEGRPAAEQIEDICRSGAISVPFQHDNEFTISTFRVATSDELTNARVFRDQAIATAQPNIICEPGQPPMIELSQTPDNKVVNEIEMRFEDDTNVGAETPFTVDDPNQKLKAGRQLGPDHLLSVPKRYVAFGVVKRAEAVRLAYRLLKFGQFDEGGTDNNLKLKITVPFEHVLGLKRYEIIKVVSELLEDFTIGYGDLSETPEYFRILHMKKVSGGRCEITAQAYNHTSYTAFEDDSGTAGTGSCTVSNCGIVLMRGVYSYDGEVNGRPSYRKGDYTIQWGGGVWDMSTVYQGTDQPYPWLATWSLVDPPFGIPPPVVREGQPPIGNRTAVTLGTPTYDLATGLITIPTS